MGMYYMFMNNSGNYDLEDSFPDDLGWFCERKGGWGYQSEFSQLERILEIDLKLLDHTRFEFGEDEDDLDGMDPGSLKATVAEFTDLIEHFISKIKSNPSFYDRIEYRENNADLCKKYLSSSELMDDLNALLEVMNLYRKNQIDEFEITYG